MNKISIDKFLIIVFVFIAFVFFICTNSKATDMTITMSNDEEVTFKNFPDVTNKQFLILNCSYTYNNKIYYNYYLYVYDLNVTCVATNVSRLLFCDGSAECYHIDTNDKNNLIFGSSSSVGSTTLSNSPSSYYSTTTIYNNIKGGTEVFQKAPQKTVEQITIPAIQQVEEIPQTMKEILKMIIPIGLIIFGIGLLIYLMRLVILQMT